jgi:hypothetical protein
LGRKIVLAITLLMSVMVMSCGGGSGETSPTIVLINRSGTVSPVFMFEETVTINGTSMHVKRTGGAQIIVGDWDVTITQAEADNINNLRNMINPFVDKDAVSATGPLGGGLTELHIGGAVYYNGRVNNPVTSQTSFHTFSLHVQNLADYINDLLAEYGFNVRTLPEGQ